MTFTPTLALGVVAMVFSQPRLTERALGDVAVIRIPRAVTEMYKGGHDLQVGRLMYTFSDDYFWASFGSRTAYKQQLFISVMAPDATDAEYSEHPARYTLTYNDRKTVRTVTVGSGTLKVVEGVYVQNSLAAPAHTFFYVDRARRLQIVWHAVQKEVDLATGVDVIARMAASFRITRDPAAQFADLRDRPRREAEDRARKRALAMETLQREGYGVLEPGKPVFKDGVYVEWMVDPEPRFQLLVPLGRVGSSPTAPPVSRPRPAVLRTADGKRRELAGALGWREFIDGEWRFHNDENAYLPMAGTAATLAAQQTDPAFVYFYYSATVRVEEESGDERLRDLRWFFDSLAEVRRLWSEGKLVTGGAAASD
ncbi:MAG TPA: hypothetical protein VFZ21_05535 [Gemmatimonadaceae bacterium]|nr:hypothetical protein [Gemmatimonadaceae bacterium]